MVVEAKERISEPGRNAVPPIPALDERSLAQIIEAHAREAPQAPCLEYLGVSINYAALDRWANRFAHVLKDKGVTQGDVIGIHLPNTPQYVIALIAASKLGCPASGVSPLLTASELAYQVKDAHIRVLVTLDQLYHSALAPNDGQLPDLKAAIVCSPIDFLPGWKKTLAHLLRKVPKFSLPQTRQLPLAAFWPAINAADDDRVASEIGLDDVVRDPFGLEPLDEHGCDLIVATDDDMTSHAGRHSPRRPEPHLGFEPGRVEEADKGKRQHDQQQHDP